MGQIPWILVAVAILLVVFGIVAIFVSKKNKRPPDSYNFFIIGLIWTIIGLPSLFRREYELSSLFIIGLVFLVVGLANKSKWEANRVRWNDLDSKEQKLKLYLMLVLGILLFAGLVVMYFNVN